MQETIAGAYLSNAWREVVSDGRTPDALPQNLAEMLTRLGAAARLWLAEKGRPQHRPPEHSIRELAVFLLAKSFERVFGTAPTYGSGSPFVKFCKKAFPIYGFKAPSLEKLRDPLGVGKAHE